MSDSIKHECGIALLKLKKPLTYYYDKYGSSFYALNKMYLLMEKQINRGQDGAGIVNIKFDAQPGSRYISRKRSVSSKAIADIFRDIQKKFRKLDKQQLSDPLWLKENMPFSGELWLGHLRYGTFGGNSIEACHPFLRQNNWMTRNLVVAGNFNLTNVDELFGKLVSLGQHPKEFADTVTVMEKIGHFLDLSVEKSFRQFKEQGYNNYEISHLIAKELNVQRILQKSAQDWDGGYAMAGLLGHGDAFVLRDPSGIRPAYYYQDDEIVVVASERPVIQTAFNVPFNAIQELTPGYALIIKKDKDAEELLVREPFKKTSCSFERIYFSRGNDAEVYQERKNLGALLAKRIIKEINGDVANTVFSFIPNTAETAFYGLIKGLENELNEIKSSQILALGNQGTKEKLQEILATRVRIEKLALKDAKLRTFITNDANRDDLVASSYDITYGSVNKHLDTLVMVDDSIVRGTTLKKSILKILDRLQPKKIIVVSSAPQIRYPDCYGIDMAKIGDFISFQAAIALHKERGTTHVLDEVYSLCKHADQNPEAHSVNYVKAIYNAFSDAELESKIAQLVTPDGIAAEVQLVFQSVDNLHIACPKNEGDWYFTGNYPTLGGSKVVNRAFVNFYEGKNTRAY